MQSGVALFPLIALKLAAVANSDVTRSHVPQGNGRVEWGRRTKTAKEKIKS